MFGALLIILLLPIVDLGLQKGFQFRPISKIMFYIFVVNFLILLSLGAKHVESPYVELGQISTIIYFGYFLIGLPLISILENILVYINYNIYNKK